MKQAPFLREKKVGETKNGSYFRASVSLRPYGAPMAPLARPYIYKYIFLINRLNCTLQKSKVTYTAQLDKN